MIKIFKATERRFEENPGRIDGFRLASDAAITSGMAAARGIGNATMAGGASTKDGNTGSNDGNQGATNVLGAGSLNFDVRRLDPGELSSLYHFHRHAEELFMMISGTATLRTPDGLHSLEAGDIAFFGTGEGGAHQMYNDGDGPCIYLDVRTFLGADIAEYSDSGRMLVIPTMEQFYKSSRTGYFDGESAEAAIRHFKKDE